MDLQELTNRKSRFFIVTLVIILACSTIAAASYLHTAFLNGYPVTARDEFYFTSDLLKEGSDIPTYYMSHDWQSENTAVIQFILKNHESPLNISDRNISFSAQASASGGSISGTIAAGGIGGNEEAVNLTVPRPFDITVPLEVTVSATATSPYTKTLQAIFVISPAVSYEMDENANSPVAVLSITLARGDCISKNAFITWPTGASPDMTNPLVIGAVNCDLANRTLTVVLNTASDYELLFFKDDASANYSGVTVTGV